MFDPPSQSLADESAELKKTADATNTQDHEHAGKPGTPSCALGVEGVAGTWTCAW
jgi:hypothetical protein